MAEVDTYRLGVARRAGFRCEYCRYPGAASSTPLEVDHILPKVKGGPTALDNLALCCRACNLHTYVKTEAIDPGTGETVPLFNPRIHQWVDHLITLD